MERFASDLPLDFSARKYLRNSVNFVMPHQPTYLYAKTNYECINFVSMLKTLEGEYDITTCLLSISHVTNKIEDIGECRETFHAFQHFELSYRR